MQIPPTLSISPPTPLRRSAEALESAFLAEMLKSSGLVRASSEMNGGSGEEQFASFLADAQARAMVARGGIGLADVIERALIARSAGSEGSA
jgi:Rod binding domain-containing protein